MNFPKKIKIKGNMNNQIVLSFINYSLKIYSVKIIFSNILYN